MLSGLGSSVSSKYECVSISHTGMFYLFGAAKWVERIYTHIMIVFISSVYLCS